MMTITKTSITVRELVAGYVNETENDIEKAVMAYDGKLCVRPAFQRSFVYDSKQENAVIDTVLKGFPLNIMYWVDNGDGTYDCLDGQQRTISLCNFADGIHSYQGNACNLEPEKHYNIVNLKRLGLADRFFDYELEVYICKGSKKEQLEWFHVINIAGEELSNQELRNASFVGPWLSDAKRYFSKANTSGTCPAERIGKKYTKKDANRQELLEQAIIWHCGSNKDEDICNYMSQHMDDPNAKDLWNYYNDVISWAAEFFDDYEDIKELRTTNWGKLYAEYGNVDYDIDEMHTLFNDLLEDKTDGRLDVSNGKIIEYCFTRDEKTLKSRKFSENQRRVLYNRQNGICPDCGQPFDIKKMQAHHIIPWWDDRCTTDLDNGVMLCKDCHTTRHANQYCPF